MTVLFTLSLNILELKSQCTEGVKYVNFHLRTLITIITCENHSNRTAHSQFTIWNLKNKLNLRPRYPLFCNLFKWLHLNMQYIFYKQFKMRDIGQVGDKVVFKIEVLHVEIEFINISKCEVL